MPPTTRPLLLAGLLLAACGADDPALPDARTYDAMAPDAEVPPDAAGPDLSCLGLALPDTAPAQVTLSGNVFELQVTDLVPRGGVTTDVYETGDQTTVLATDDSADGTGAYALSLTTGGVPVDVYLHHHADGLLETFTTLPTAVHADLPDMITVVSGPAQFSLFQSFFDLEQDEALAFVVVVALDCAMQPLPGAVVTTTEPAETVMYTDAASTPSTELTETSAAGTVYLVNAPAAPATFGFTLDGVPLRARAAAVRAYGGTTHNVVFVGP